MRFENQDFTRVRLRNDGGTYSDAEFENCVFERCLVSPEEDDVGSRITIRNVTLRNCTIPWKFAVSNIVVEDCVISNVTWPKAASPFVIRGAHFRHTALSGSFEAMNVFEYPKAYPSDDSYNDEWFEFTGRYYADVDWALDITKATFADAPNLVGVPGRLIRRDPETSVLLTRERISTRPWDPHAIGIGSTWRDDLLDFPHSESSVIAAPMKGPKKVRERYLRAFDKLRELGFVEPD